MACGQSAGRDNLPFAGGRSSIVPLLQHRSPAKIRSRAERKFPEDHLGARFNRLGGNMFQQNYDPLGNAFLSTVVAAIP
ncbi:MAG TPA: hypothetical protein VIK97_19445, partial [Casimicrobiaceae bacterium]